MKKKKTSKKKYPDKTFKNPWDLDGKKAWTAMHNPARDEFLRFQSWHENEKRQILSYLFLTGMHQIKVDENKN